MKRYITDILVRVAALLAILFAGTDANAQSDAQFSQYYQIKN